MLASVCANGCKYRQQFYNHQIQLSYEQKFDKANAPCQQSIQHLPAGLFQEPFEWLDDDLLQ